MFRPRALCVFVLALTGLLSAQSAEQDGGMWTFDNLPLERLESKYGFQPDQAWINHVQSAAVRVSTGGSGSFVSASGLVMTNHHVALELVNKLSNAENDLVTNGFHAKSFEEELRCPDASLSQLIKMIDVTAEVVQAGADAGDNAGNARRAKIDELQKKLSADSGLTVEIVTLYGGGQFVAYHYKVYDDVRLVFAPEMRVAYYGGDFDNFTYPRYCLDMAFLRAYENDKPADTSKHHFKWNRNGAKEGELTFVAGHPGRTSRLWPLSRKQHDRDGYNPAVVALLEGRDRALSRYMERGSAERLEVLDEVFGIRNSMKAYQGMLDGLNNPEIWSQLAALDADFRKDAAGDEEVAEALKTFEETRAARDSVVFDLILVRLEGEIGTTAALLFDLKRRMERAGAEKSEEAMAALKERAEALAGKTWNATLERERFIGGLDAARSGLPAGHPFREKLFTDAEETAEAAADRLLKASVVADAERRTAALSGDFDAFVGLEDPLVEIAGWVQSRRARAGQTWAQATASEEEASAALARARLRIYGKSLYPDATFTLRLTFGVGKRYELGTTIVPWTTTFNGLFERNTAMGGEVPFDLPKRWLEKREALDLNTPYNFVSTHDIIGGNSGSPVFNKNLEIVGLIFDGNIQSLPNNYLYLDRVCRAVSVHSAGMTHALERVYEAYGILAELGLR